LSCDSNGIAHNLELYSGKAVLGPSLPDVGKSGNVVLRLASVIPRSMFHKLYFDNWFTGVQLVIELEKLGIHSLGTVRPNRLKVCKFSFDKEMKTRGRGSYEKFSCKVDSISLNAVKLYDNKPGHLLSTFVGAHPTSAVQRWDRDSLIALYHIKIRSKKWYLRTVVHLLDLTVVNAWLLYRRDCTGRGMNKTDQLSLLDIKSSVAACL
jgi:hypothetical protein